MNDSLVESFLRPESQLRHNPAASQRGCATWCSQITHRAHCAPRGQKDCWTSIHWTFFYYKKKHETKHHLHHDMTYFFLLLSARAPLISISLALSFSCSSLSLSLSLPHTLFILSFSYFSVLNYNPFSISVSWLQHHASPLLLFANRQSETRS